MQSKKIKILLIEDDLFLSGIFLSKFELEGFEIISAKDGEEGLKLARQEKPEAILLDILLPKKNGFSVLEELKENPTTKNIPVIVMTNLSEDHDVKRAAGLGATDYLVKSNFLPNEVVEKVKKVLTRN